MLAIVVALAAVAPVTAGEPDKKPGTFPALSAKQLQAIMPKLSGDRAAAIVEPLNDAMREFGIDTPKRQAAFLAQVAQESGELRYMEDFVSNGNGYRGAGNGPRGDDGKYHGRGPLRLAGRTHYRQAGQVLKLDLETHPDMVSKPEVGCRAAGWYWKVQSFNELADRGDLRTITRRISGDYTSLQQRQSYYRRAKDVLGVKE
jgi:putative chitinase